MILQDCVACNEHEKYNLFAQHFQQTSNKCSASDIQINEAIICDMLDFCIPYTTPAMVLNAVQKLKHSFSAGPDGIPSSVLIRCANVFKYPLAILFSRACFLCVGSFRICSRCTRRAINGLFLTIVELHHCAHVRSINDVVFARCKNYIDIEQHSFYPK